MNEIIKLASDLEPIFKSAAGRDIDLNAMLKNQMTNYAGPEATKRLFSPNKKPTPPVRLNANDVMRQHMSDFMGKEKADRVMRGQKLDPQPEAAPQAPAPAAAPVVRSTAALRAPAQQQTTASDLDAQFNALLNSPDQPQAPTAPAAPAQQQAAAAAPRQTPQTAQKSMPARYRNLTNEQMGYYGAIANRHGAKTREGGPVNQATMSAYNQLDDLFGREYAGLKSNYQRAQQFSKRVEDRYKKMVEETGGPYQRRNGEVLPSETLYYTDAGAGSLYGRLTGRDQEEIQNRLDSPEYAAEHRNIIQGLWNRRKKHLQSQGKQLRGIRTRMNKNQDAMLAKRIQQLRAQHKKTKQDVEAF